MNMPLSDDLVIRLRGLMATAEMDFYAINNVLGDGPEVESLKDILDALVCISEILTTVMANHCLTHAQLYRQYHSLYEDLARMLPLKLET